MSTAATTVAALQTNNSAVPFQTAAEYLMDDSFECLFKSNELLTLKDNYVLVEMSYIKSPIQYYAILFDLKVAGYVPSIGLSGTLSILSV